MNLTRDEVEQLYLEVSTEYNATSLATGDGWIHSPTEFGLREMCALAAYLPPNGVLVDIGTGMGIGARFGRKLGARVISVDSLDAGGRSPIENLKTAGVECHFCDVLRESLPIESGVADCVLFADVIEHLIHSPKPVLLEILRVLKPGGVCIATTPNALRLTARLKVMLGYSNWPNLREYFDAPFNGSHHHEYTIEDFKFVFTATNFSIIEFVLYENNLRVVQIGSLRNITTQMRGKRVPSSEPLRFKIVKAPLLALVDIFPWLRSNMILIARKPI